jgi:hypothetical protein
MAGLRPVCTGLSRQAYNNGSLPYSFGSGNQHPFFPALASRWWLKQNPVNHKFTPRILFNRQPTVECLFYLSRN